MRSGRLGERVSFPHSSSASSQGPKSPWRVWPIPIVRASPAGPPGRAVPPAPGGRGARRLGRARRQPGCAGAWAQRRRSRGAGLGPEHGRAVPVGRAAPRGLGRQRGARPRQPVEAAVVPEAPGRRTGRRPGGERRRWRRAPGRRAVAAAGRAAGSRAAGSRRQQRRPACGRAAAPVRRPPGAEMTGGPRQPLRPARRGAPGEGEGRVRRPTGS